MGISLPRERSSHASCDCRGFALGRHVIVVGSQPARLAPIPIARGRGGPGSGQGRAEAMIPAGASPGMWGISPQNSCKHQFQK